jgi:NAD(P)-dependent dehydrogenase (short-subunit alcohol dehydrogenase family)
MRLKGKVAIVTGAGSGIGRASALLFASEGASAVAGDVNMRAVEETAALANGAGKVVGVQADVSKSSDVAALVRTAVESFGGLDVVFSNAGVMRGGSVVDLPEPQWDELFAVNVKGAFLLGKHALPHMRRPPAGRGRGGSFIITASANSFYAESDIAGYCATKGAAMQLARAMAIDHSPEGVRVNCICPGWIETPMSAPFLTENPGGRDFAGRIAPSGRIGTPEDVARVALFLASEESAFVTGAAYVVDGGWTAGMAKAVALI